MQALHSYIHGIPSRFSLASLAGMRGVHGPTCMHVHLQPLGRMGFSKCPASSAPKSTPNGAGPIKIGCLAGELCPKVCTSPSMQTGWKTPLNWAHVAPQPCDGSHWLLRIPKAYLTPHHVHFQALESSARLGHSMPWQAPLVGQPPQGTPHSGCSSRLVMLWNTRVWAWKCRAWAEVPGT